MKVEISRWKNKDQPSRKELDGMFRERQLDYYSFGNVKGYHYAAHEHEYNKFLVMAKGKMKWIIEGKENILSEGDAVVLPKHTQHEVIVLEDCECLEGHF